MSLCGGGSWHWKPRFGGPSAWHFRRCPELVSVSPWLQNPAVSACVTQALHTCTQAGASAPTEPEPLPHTQSLPEPPTGPGEGGRLPPHDSSLGRLQRHLGQPPRAKCHPSHPRAGSTQCHARAGLEQPPCHPVRVSWRCGSIDTTGIGEHYTTALPPEPGVKCHTRGLGLSWHHHLPSCFPTGIHLGWGKSRDCSAIPFLDSCTVGLWAPASFDVGLSRSGMGTGPERGLRFKLRKNVQLSSRPPWGSFLLEAKVYQTWPGGLGMCQSGYL